MFLTNLKIVEGIYPYVTLDCLNLSVYNFTFFSGFLGLSKVHAFFSIAHLIKKQSTKKKKTPKKPGFFL